MKALVALVLTLATVGLLGATTSTPASADGYRWDASCNCNRPFTSRRVVYEAPLVNYRTRVEASQQVIPRYQTIEENQLVVHVRPVIQREIVLHRQYVHYQNIVTRRLNTVNRYQTQVVYGGVVNQYATIPSYSTVYRTVLGTNCNCGGGY
jgi:hypothetical protein